MKYSFFILLIFTSLGCGDNDCIIHYLLDIPINVTPVTETYRVGDTLIISANIDNQNIHDTHGNRIIDIPYFDPNAWFLMPILDTFPVKDGFLENEIIIDDIYETQYIPVSTLSSGIFFLGIETQKLESLLDFKVILNTPGTYALYSISEIERNSDDINFDGRCGKSRGGSVEGEFSYTSDIHDSILTDQNKTVEDEYWNERSGQRLESSPYYFRVIE